MLRLKYYNVLKWEKRLTLVPNAAKKKKQKNNCMKKKLEVKVVENSIPYKELSGRTCLYPPCVEQVAEKIAMFKIL